MNVRFLFRPSSSHPTRGTIQCRITVAGKRATPFATGVGLSRSDWNARLQQLKGRSERAQIDNTRLERIRGKLMNIFNYYDTHNMQVSAELIKEVYAGKRSVQYSLTQIVQMFLDSEQGRVGDGDKQISQETFNGKKNRLSHLTNWLKAHGRQHLLGAELKKGHVIEWVNDMQGSYKHNYIAKHIDLLHEVLDWAVLHEHIGANKLGDFRYSREKPERPEYLSTEEIERLEKLTFPRSLSLAYSGRLEKVRDMLMMMCAVGMHYSDYAKLSSSDLRTYPEGKYIVVLRKKTKKEAIIPLSPLAQRIIDIYGSLEALPRPGNAQSNKLLKMIVACAKIDKPKICTKYGRRSFTDFYLNEMGWPMEKLLKMLGLTSSQYIAHYGQIDHRSLRLEDRSQKELTEREQLEVFEGAIGGRFRLKAGQGNALEDEIAGVDWKYLHVQSRQYGNFHVSLCELIK